ncbi:hypothetical protein MMPV_008785 [Pyropia vietnamensis]
MPYPAFLPPPASLVDGAPTAHARRRPLLLPGSRSWVTATPARERRAILRGCLPSPRAAAAPGHAVSATASSSPPPPPPPPPPPADANGAGTGRGPEGRGGRRRLAPRATAAAATGSEAAATTGSEAAATTGSEAAAPLAAATATLRGGRRQVAEGDSGDYGAPPPTMRSTESLKASIRAAAARRKAGDAVGALQDLQELGAGSTPAVVALNELLITLGSVLEAGDATLDDVSDAPGVGGGPFAVSDEMARLVAASPARINSRTYNALLAGIQADITIAARESRRLRRSAAAGGATAETTAGSDGGEADETADEIDDDTPPPPSSSLSDVLAAVPGRVETIFDSMVASGVPPDNFTMTMVYKLLGRARAADTAWRLWKFAEAKLGIVPDVVSSTALVHCLARVGAAKRVDKVVAAMHAAGVAPNVRTHGAIIHGLSVAGQHTKALAHFARVINPPPPCPTARPETAAAQAAARAAAVKPNIYLYGAILSACARAGDGKSAQVYLAEAIKRRIAPNDVLLGHVLDAAVRGCDLQLAVKVLLELMPRWKVMPKVQDFNRALSLCGAAGGVSDVDGADGGVAGEAGRAVGAAPTAGSGRPVTEPDSSKRALQIQLSVELVRRMQQDYGLFPNVDTYHILIGVCGRCGDAASAVRIFRRRFTVPPAVLAAAGAPAAAADVASTAVGPATATTYTTLLWAVLECSSVPHCLHVLRLMREAGVVPDEAVSRAVASLARSTGDVELLLALSELTDMGDSRGGAPTAAAPAGTAPAVGVPAVARMDARDTRDMVTTRAETWTIAQLSNAVASIGTVDAGVVVALLDAAVAARDVSFATALLFRAVWEHGRDAARWPLSAYSFNVVMDLVGQTAPKAPLPPKSRRGRKPTKKPPAAATAVVAEAGPPSAGTIPSTPDGGVARVRALLALMKRIGVSPTEVSYATATAVAARAGAVETAARLAAEMQDVGLGGVDSYAWTSLLDALGKGGHWARAVELLNQMRAAARAMAAGGAPVSLAVPSIESYNTVLYAAGMAGERDVAFGVWDALVADGVAADEVTYSSLASICLKCQRDVDETRVRKIVEGLALSQDARAAIKGRRPSKKLSDKINRLRWLLPTIVTQFASVTATSGGGSGEAGVTAGGRSGEDRPLQP